MNLVMLIKGLLTGALAWLIYTETGFFTAAAIFLIFIDFEYIRQSLFTIGWRKKS